MNFQQLVLASHNAGKLKELQAMLGESVQLRSIGEFSQVEPEETGLSFVENAILKARNASYLRPAGPGRRFGPGSGRSGRRTGHLLARYADGKGDAANNAKLLQALRDVPAEERGAQFVCVLALVRHADDPLPILCEGLWHGSILFEASGEHGFGYDPLFWVPSASAPAPTSALSKRTSSATAPAPWPCCVNVWAWHDRNVVHPAAPLRRGRFRRTPTSGLVYPYSLVRAQMPLLRLQFSRCRA